MKTKLLFFVFLLLPFLTHARIHLIFDYEYDVFSHGKPLNIRIEGKATDLWIGGPYNEYLASDQIVLNPGEKKPMAFGDDSFGRVIELKFYIQDPFNLNHWIEVDGFNSEKYYFSGNSRINVDYRHSPPTNLHYKLKFEMPRVLFKGSHVNPADVNVNWVASTGMTFREQINPPRNFIDHHYSCIVKPNQIDTSYFRTTQEIISLYSHVYNIYIQGQRYTFYTNSLLQEGTIYFNNDWYIKFDPADSDVDNFYYSYIIGYGNRARIMQQELELQEAATPVTIYPNPATDHINIGYDLEQNTELTIYSMDGKIMEKVILNSELNTIRVETPHYKSGMYMFRYGNETGKFIIK